MCDTFVIVNTGSYSRIHDTSLPGVHSNQWKWLNDTLTTAQKNPERLLALVSHWDYTQGISEDFHSYNQFQNLIDTYPIDVLFIGHQHRNREVSIENKTTKLIFTASLINGNYRIIEIKDSQAVKYDPQRLKPKKNGK